MRRAPAVGAHLLQLGHTEALQRVWHGHADTREVLVVGKTADLDGLPVKQHPLVRVELYLAVAERGRDLVAHRASGIRHRSA